MLGLGWKSDWNLRSSSLRSVHPCVALSFAIAKNEEEGWSCGWQLGDIFDRKCQGLVLYVRGPGASMFHGCGSAVPRAEHAAQANQPSMSRWLRSPVAPSPSPLAVAPTRIFATQPSSTPETTALSPQLPPSSTHLQMSARVPRLSSARAENVRRA